MTSAWKSLAFALLGSGLLQAEVPFDGGALTLPGAQGWSYLAIPGTAKHLHTGRGVRLDTLDTPAETAGFARIQSYPLDRQAGFGLALRLRLLDENHVRADRAGFSVILLGADRRGVELGFWRDRVFAQSDEPLLAHGEEALFPFDQELADVSVSVHGTNYTVRVNRQPVLHGPLKDYAAFTGFPDVYETANFIFLGDDTTSASANVEIVRAALVLPPTLRFDRSGSVTWKGLPGETYSVEVSPDLLSWQFAGRATSAKEDFQFSLLPESLLGFVRVVYP